MAKQNQKQLFELLEEQQEPFDFEAHLLENGCSSKRLQRISSNRSTAGRGNAVGFFRSILTKLVHRKAFGRSPSLHSKSSSQSARPSVFSCFSDTGAMTPDMFSVSGAISGGPSAEEEWRRCMETDCSKQHSPVSVLEFHHHKRTFKEDSSSTTSSFDSPREAQDIYGFSRHCSGDSKQQLMEDCVKEAEEMLWDSGDVCLSTEEVREKLINDKIIAWQRLRGDVSSLTKLLGSDIAECSKEWSKFGPEVTDLGIEIESAILEEIVHETVLDMIAFSHCR